MEQVILSKCKSYERVEVEKAVHSIFNDFGGLHLLAQKIKPGMKILVKPNLLAGDSPAKGITTHPEVVRAVLKELLSLGALPIVGDSPGYGSLTKVAEKAGIAKVCRELGVRLATFDEVVEVRTNSAAKLMNSFSLAKEVIEAEAIINIPKMKTHGMARITGCVKNLYGCIVGVRKAELHFRLQKNEVFMEMLIDLAETVRPVYNIVDAVMAMEGSGPRNGDLRPVGLIMAGDNPFAVDTVMAQMMGLRVNEVPFLTLAAKRGKNGVDPEEIKIMGEDINEYIFRDYRVPTAPLWVKLKVPEWVSKLVRRHVSPYPVIRENCRLCNVCVGSCPAGIMTVSKSKGKSFISIDDKKCIRCYCCQELCPHNAIELKIPVLGSILFHRRRSDKTNDACI